ncbi:MAG: hypothetical protein M4579_006750 [Chaenotheca gracillima]|nr:MAG: hypothetical protein M4579_006750 [Chaenotheca gracillima]
MSRKIMDDRLKMLMGNDSLPVRMRPVEKEPEMQGPPSSEHASAPEGTLQHSGSSFLEKPDHKDVDKATEKAIEHDQVIPASSWDTIENATNASEKLSPLKPQQRTNTKAPDHGSTSTIHQIPAPLGALGQLAAAGRSFCPLKAISKYPYKYVPKRVQEPVASSFFASGKFWEKGWEVYYIYPLGSSTLGPLLLVPFSQVQELLVAVNTALNLNLTLPRDPEEIGFLLHFEDDYTPRPRYLGLATVKMSFENLEGMIPLPGFKPKDEPAEAAAPSDRSLAAFKLKVERGIAATQRSKNAAKLKRQENRIQSQQGWGNQIKRLHRYLGLRERSRESSDSGAPPSTSGIASCDDHPTTGVSEAPKPVPGPVDMESAAPYVSDSSVVFIAVDLEAYERNHKLVTEIGIATLDTLDLAGVSPGEGAKNWNSKIRARHIRIQEHGHLHNTDFVAGCADKFEFGESEWTSLESAPQLVASCFRAPFSGPSQAEDMEPSLLTASPTPKRNIILVGHDISMDISYLHTLGYSPLTLPNLVETLDTMLMYRSLKRELQARSLGQLLYDFDLMGWNLHNAGNDAVYTLQAMIAIAFKGISLDGRTKEEKDTEKWNKVRATMDEAVDKAKMESEGWSSGGEGDGGPAVPSKVTPPTDSKGKAKADSNADIPEQ